MVLSCSEAQQWTSFWKGSIHGWWWTSKLYMSYIRFLLSCSESAVFTKPCPNWQIVLSSASQLHFLSRRRLLEITSGNRPDIIAVQVHPMVHVGRYPGKLSKNWNDNGHGHWKSYMIITNHDHDDDDDENDSNDIYIYTHNFEYNVRL